MVFHFLIHRHLDVLPAQRGEDPDEGNSKENSLFGSSRFNTSCSFIVHKFNTGTLMFKKLLCKLGLHNYSEWETTSSGELTTGSPGDKRTIGIFRVQERTCEWCKKLEINKLSVDVTR